MEKDKLEIHLAETLEDATEILKKHPDQATKPDKNGVQAIHYAAANSTIEHIKFLLEKGANLESTTTSGKKPIHYAAMSDNTPVVEWLIAENINFNCQDDKLNCTPLIYATMLNNIPTAISLIKASCTLDTTDNSGNISI